MAATIIISTAAGAAAAMGLGGGSFLILYLTVFLGMAQNEAQGINLIFFIPCAAIALWLHSRQKLVCWKDIIPALIAGTFTAALGAFLFNKIDSEISKKIFGAFIIIMGMKALSEKKTL
ncbi:MAG: sulfite exporter TauE/SafE family protein [Ruminococcus sp.]|nr:sulfite exporter TauE/SafE family protein [Ruminococcus sp.]